MTSCLAPRRPSARSSRSAPAARSRATACCTLPPMGCCRRRRRAVAAGLTEAALLLTPPDAASDEDDGLLTASEVTLLKLNADWVIMSACNTGRRRQIGRGAVRPRARVLLCRRPRAAGVALVRGLGLGGRADDENIRRDEARSQARAGRSAAPLDAGADRERRPLRPSRQLGAVRGGWGRRGAESRKKTAVVAPPAAPATPPVPVLPAVVVPPAPPATPPTPIEPAVGIPSTIKVNPLSPERERALKPKDSFKECDACPEMVVVPAGSFTMGSPASEKERSSDEGPQRRVTFARQFAVGKFAVTFDEWDACVADGGCNGYRPERSGLGPRQAAGDQRAIGMTPRPMWRGCRARPARPIAC